MGILYMLTFASGKSYIGITEKDDMSKRLIQHKAKSKRGQLPIHLAWKKYENPKVTTLGVFYGDDLFNAEIEAIAKYKTISPNGYNILEGGQKSPSLNKDVAKKISISTKRRYENPQEREKASYNAKNRTLETRKKISIALTGKVLSEETKQKIRDANIGKKHLIETKQKMSKSHTGKKYSEETLEKMRQAAKKRMQSPEAKLQLKNASIAGGNATKNKANIKKDKK